MEITKIPKRKAGTIQAFVSSAAPCISAGEAVEAEGISGPSLRYAVASLQKAGQLDPSFFVTTKGGKGKVFLARK